MCACLVLSHQENDAHVMGCDMKQGKKERDTGAELPTPPEADHHIATLLELPQVMPHLFV
jgi:hypothetical protein